MQTRIPLFLAGLSELENQCLAGFLDRVDRAECQHSDHDDDDPDDNETKISTSLVSSLLSFAQFGQGQVGHHSAAGATVNYHLFRILQHSLHPFQVEPALSSRSFRSCIRYRPRQIASLHHQPPG